MWSPAEWRSLQGCKQAATTGRLECQEPAEQCVPRSPFWRTELVPGEQFSVTAPCLPPCTLLTYIPVCRKLIVTVPPAAFSDLSLAGVTTDCRRWLFSNCAAYWSLLCKFMLNHLLLSEMLSCSQNTSGRTKINSLGLCVHSHLQKSGEAQSWSQLSCRYPWPSTAFPSPSSDPQMG